MAGKRVRGGGFWWVALAACLTLPATLWAGTNVWTSSGPPGGDVNALLVDPVSASTFYAGTRGGVFKSTDAGLHWASSSEGLAGTVYALAAGVDPGHPLYAAADGVYKSTDAGATWTKLPTNDPSASVRCLAVDASAPGTLYYGSGTGVRKTTDGGATWTPASTGLTSTNVWSLAIIPSAPSTLFAGTYDAGVCKSTDGGASWADASVGLTSLRVLALLPDPSNGDVVYAGTYGGVFKSVDGGATWTQPPATGMGFQQIAGLAFLPGTPSPLWAMTQATLYKSVDGGQTYTQGAYVGTVSFDCIAASPQAPQTICAGAKTVGMFRTTTGGPNWDAANAGLSGTLLFAVTGDRQTPSVLYCGGDPGVVARSTDGGASWTKVTTGLPSSIRVLTLAADPITPGTLYLGSDGSGTFKTTDGGNTWAAAGAGAPNSGYALAVDPVHPQTVYAGGRLDASSHLKKSTDGGSTWTNADAGLTGDYAFGLVIDPSSTDTLYTIARGGGVFKSTDGGTSWSPVNQGLPGLYWNALAIDPVVPSTLYVSITGQPVYKTTDGGATWAPTNSGNVNPNLGAGIAVDPTAHDTVYALSAGASVLRSTDGGGTWSPLPAAGLSNNSFRGILLEPGLPRRIHVATYGGGVFSYEDCPASTCSAAGPSTGVAGTSVSFTSTVAPGPCSSGSPTFSWDFGDGTALSDEQNPSHVYASGGSYTWQVVVVLGQETCSSSGGITISPPCTLACSATAPATATVGLPAHFSASAAADHCSGEPAFDWDFGDGSPHSDEQNPSHTYASALGTTWFMTASVDGETCVHSGPITAVPPPVVSLLKKVVPPFSIAVTGTNLQSGIRVFINGTEWTSVKYKKSTKIKLTGGSALKALVPKGAQTQFRFLNPDGGEAFTTWSY